jgi:D-3-phosphoglycerate dehydrogenase
VSGTLAGTRHVEKLVEVDGYDIEVQPTAHMVFMRYADRPGIVGTVGRILGEASINIAGMQVSREAKGGQALVGMTVDTAVPADLMQRMLAEIGAEFGRAVDLDD